MDGTEPIIPQDEQTPDGINQDPGYSNEDLQKESIRDIAANTEEPKEELKEPETPPTETPKEPEVDPAKIAEEAARKVLDEQEARQVAEDEAKKKELSPEEDAYATWEKELWEKEKRQPTYREALDFVKEQAKSDIQAEQAVKETERQKELEATKTQLEENTKKINAIVDDELVDLYRGKKLTPIKDINNPSDQGRLEKESLFKKWAEVNIDRRAKGLPDILSATRIAEFYWTKPTAQPAGADAPIAGNQGSATPPSTEQEYSNEDLKRPWSFFRKH